MKYHLRDPEARARQTTLRWQDPAMRRLMTRNTKKALRRPEVRAKKSASMRKRWGDPTYRQVMIESFKNAWTQPDLRVKRSIAMQRASTPTLTARRLANLNRPSAQAKRAVARTRPEYRQGMAMSCKQAWDVLSPQAKSIRMRKIRGAAQAHPNKLEHAALQILRGAFSGVGWRFNPAEVVVDGKIPDLVREGSKVVVDVHGDYWHRNETIAHTRARVKLFNQAGYKLVVIWEHELKADPTTLVHRVTRAERLVGALR